MLSAIPGSPSPLPAFVGLGAIALAGWTFAHRRCLRSRLLDTDAALDLLVIGLGAIKLWLAAGQPLFTVPAGPFDDRLFLRQATTLLEGAWLGPYDSLTLAKGPFYSFFFAASAALHLPLPLAHNLVYIVGAWCLVRALRPVSGGLLRAIVLAALLGLPALAETGPFVRAWRQALWPGLVLLTLAAWVGLAARLGDGGRRGLGWAALAGATLAAAWMTREEAVWLLPMLAMPVFAACFTDRGGSDSEWRWVAWRWRAWWPGLQWGR